MLNPSRQCNLPAEAVIGAVYLLSDGDEGSVFAQQVAWKIAHKENYA